jgi:hypothetical protein
VRAVHQRHHHLLLRCRFTVGRARECAVRECEGARCGVLMVSYSLVCWGRREREFASRLVFDRVMSGPMRTHVLVPVWRATRLDQPLHCETLHLRGLRIRAQCRQGGARPAPTACWEWQEQEDYVEQSSAHRRLPLLHHSTWAAHRCLERPGLGLVSR